MYAYQVYKNAYQDSLELNENLGDGLVRLFNLLPDKRRIHLDSVTELAHLCMDLRSRCEPSYPIAGDQNQKHRYLIKLLLAYNLHDIGDLPIDIPEESIHTPETASRRREIQHGDWISSTDYSDEKYNGPIRGRIIAEAIQSCFCPSASTPRLNKIIIGQLPFDDVESETPMRDECDLLDLIARIAYQHHEAYNGKGWPLGIKLCPDDPTMDVTFFDFIAGWFINKSTRGDQPREIIASTPGQVLAAIAERQAESKRKYDGEPMYNPRWVSFFRTHLDEVDKIVSNIFPDVKTIRTLQPKQPSHGGK